MAFVSVSWEFRNTRKVYTEPNELACRCLIYIGELLIYGDCKPLKLGWRRRHTVAVANPNRKALLSLTTQKGNMGQHVCICRRTLPSSTSSILCVCVCVCFSWQVGHILKDPIVYRSTTTTGRESIYRIKYEFLFSFPNFPQLLSPHWQQQRRPLCTGLALPPSWLVLPESIKLITSSSGDG